MPVRPLLTAVLLAGLSVPGLSPSGDISFAQTPPLAPPQSPPVFRVDVDVIRVDAVVTDEDGRMVTDLTAADFEVRQDGELQQIAAARYISVDAPSSTLSPVPPGRRGLAPVAVAGVRPQVQRTMAIIVDDLGIAWENVEPVRRALRNFVDEVMGPDPRESDVRGPDPRESYGGQAPTLMALVLTGTSSSTPRQFTTDKHRLYSAIDQVRWNGFSRRGVGSFRAANNVRPTGGTGFSSADPTDMGLLDNLREGMSAASTLDAVTLTMQGLRDLPGRKAVVLISEGFQLTETGKEGPDDVPYQPNNLIHPGLERLMDYALRSGVVLYTMDPRGLATGGLVAEDDLKFGGSPAELGVGRRRFVLDTQDVLAYMAEQTGGLAMLNSNDLGDSLKRISDDQRGYYIIGYVPPEDTFAKPGKTARYHSLSVTVKRDGVKVRTRKGFLGVTDDTLRQGR